MSQAHTTEKIRLSNLYTCRNRTIDFFIMRHALLTHHPCPSLVEWSFQWTKLYKPVRKILKQNSMVFSMELSVSWLLGSACWAWFPILTYIENLWANFYQLWNNYCVILDDKFFKTTCRKRKTFFLWNDELTEKIRTKNESKRDWPCYNITKKMSLRRQFNKIYFLVKLPLF